MTVIIDTMVEPMLAPSGEDQRITEGLGVPDLVFTAMFVAAWSRCEFMDLIIQNRDVAAMSDDEPSQSLMQVLPGALPMIIKAACFAIPLQYDRRQARALGWPDTLASDTGPFGRN